MKNVNSWVPVIAVLIFLGMLASMVFNDNAATEVKINHSTKTPQLSYIPQGFAREIRAGEAVTSFIPEFDPRFLKLRPIEVFKIPKVDRFSAPLGTETGAFAYNAQKFWEFNERRGGHHSGDDLNGIGGGNSDLGDPVYAVADGYVAYTGEPSQGWGNVVLIAHRVDVGGEEKIVQSMYAHLEDYSVKVGQMVMRSQVIGTVGNAGGQYLAHLHFEMREGTNLYIGPGYLQRPRTQISAQQFLAPYLKDELIYTDVFQAIEISNNPWLGLEITNPLPFINLD